MKRIAFAISVFLLFVSHYSHAAGTWQCADVAESFLNANPNYVATRFGSGPIDCGFFGAYYLETLSSSTNSKTVCLVSGKVFLPPNWAVTNNNLFGTSSTCGSGVGLGRYNIQRLTGSSVTGCLDYLDEMAITNDWIVSRINTFTSSNCRYAGVDRLTARFSAPSDGAIMCVPDRFSVPTGFVVSNIGTYSQCYDGLVSTGYRLGKLNQNWSTLACAVPGFTIPPGYVIERYYSSHNSCGWYGAYSLGGAPTGSLSYGICAASNADIPPGFVVVDVNDSPFGSFSSCQGIYKQVSIKAAAHGVNSCQFNSAYPIVPPNFVVSRMRTSSACAGSMSYTLGSLPSAGSTAFACMAPGYTLDPSYVIAQFHSSSSSCDPNFIGGGYLDAVTIAPLSGNGPYWACRQSLGGALQLPAGWGVTAIQQRSQCSSLGGYAYQIRRLPTDGSGTLICPTPEAPYPDGFVITSKESSWSGCADGQAWRVKFPEDGDVVCTGSQVPSGFAMTSFADRLACGPDSIVGSNSYRIEFASPGKSYTVCDPSQFSGFLVVGYDTGFNDCIGSASIIQVPSAGLDVCAEVNRGLIPPEYVVSSVRSTNSCGTLFPYSWELSSVSDGVIACHLNSGSFVAPSGYTATSITWNSCGGAQAYRLNVLGPTLNEFILSSEPVDSSTSPAAVICGSTQNVSGTFTGSIVQSANKNSSNCPQP